MNKPVSPAAVIRGEEHWTNKGNDVRLFLWNKHAGDPSGPAGTILFVHGSSMASQPTFDLQVPGAADRRWIISPRRGTTPGASTWRGTADRPRIVTTIRPSRTAPTIASPPRAISRNCAARSRYWSTAFPRARCVPRCSRNAIPSDGGAARARRDGVDRRGLADLAERSKRLPEFRAKNRRPIDRKFVRSIFERDHPGTADDNVIEAFADAILELDDSVPTGTYVDMCAKLPVCRSRRRSRCRRSSCAASTTASRA